MENTKAEEVTNANVMRFYWGADWPGEDYPEWELISDEQRAQLAEINALVNSEIAKANKELLDELEDIVVIAGVSTLMKTIEAKRKEIREGKR